MEPGVSNALRIINDMFNKTTPSIRCNQSKLQLCVGVHAFDVSHSLQCKLFVNNWITFQVALEANDMPSNRFPQNPVQQIQARLNQIKPLRIA